MSVESRSCPKCGGPVPAEAPQGLCPKCLLLQASIPTDAEGTATAPSRPGAPSVDELAAAFPQLQVLELIGQGGMGFVFKARQPHLERMVALKILPQSLAGDPAFAERFAREGRLLARLNHPNIVTIHDFGQAGGFFFLLMEFVDGINLRQAMQSGRFTPAQALSIVPKICEALEFAHSEGVLHRDIKPENILLDAKGRIKIADFGIAKLMVPPGATDATAVPLPDVPARAPEIAAIPQGPQLTETGRAIGTPHYMAPEQLEHPQDVDQRADIYSLGVVFYEMLTGELPIGRFAPPSQKSEVDPRIDDVVLRTLEKERERRTRTAGEVKTQVETVADSALGNQTRPIIPEVSRRGRRLTRAAVAAFIVTFVFVFCASIVVTALTPRTYVGSTRVLIQSAVSEEPGDENATRAQAEIVMSDAVMRSAIEDLHLAHTWSRRFHLGKDLSGAETVSLLRKGLAVKMAPHSHILEIDYYSGLSSEAADVANAVTDNYVEHTRKLALPNGDAENKSVRATVLQRAVPAARPVRPNIALNIVGGAAAGILLGAAVSALSVVIFRRQPSPRAGRPDRFWRYFALGSALFVVALIIIPAGLLALAIALPAYQKARGSRSRPDPSLAQPASILTITGQIRAAKTGAPIANARVATLFTEPDARPVQVTWTDEEGRFEIKSWTRRHVVNASAAGYQAHEIRIATEPGFSGSVDEFIIPHNGRLSLTINLQARPALAVAETTQPPPNAANAHDQLREMRPLIVRAREQADRRDPACAETLHTLFRAYHAYNNIVHSTDLELSFTFVTSVEKALVAIQNSDFPKASRHIRELQEERTEGELASREKRLAAMMESAATSKIAEPAPVQSIVLDSDATPVSSITFASDPNIIPSIRFEDSAQTNSGVAATAKCVIDSAPLYSPPAAGETAWNFKALIPPNHIAHLLLVRWTNGAPTIVPGLSAYYKTGKSAIDAEFFLSYTKHHEMAPGMTNNAQWSVNFGLGYTTGLPVAEEPPFQRVDPQPRVSVLSGHQRALPLIQFAAPGAMTNQTKSGVELRILLEPLRVAPVRTVPTEIDRGSYIAGPGIATGVDTMKRAIVEWPVDP